jgi:hypothetical protein
LTCWKERYLLLDCLNFFELAGGDGVAVYVEGGFPWKGFVIVVVLMAEDVFQGEGGLQES